MNVGILLKVIKEVTMKLEAMGILTADGTFTGLTVEQDSELAAFAVSELTGHGVTIPNEVTRIVQLLPLLLSIRS